jgi:hypothetical protein
MKQRVIFVGVHNKPGKSPLDSSTLTGRTVDAIASGLEDFEVVKSNMHDMECLPVDRTNSISDWRRRVKYKRTDIVVALGAQVAWDFARHHPSTIAISYIHIAHPAKRMSSVNREMYIRETIEWIKRKAT